MENQYVVVQVKFPTSTFNTTNRNEDFSTWDDVHNAAEEGKFEYDFLYWLFSDFFMVL